MPHVALVIRSKEMTGIYEHQSHFDSARHQCRIGEHESNIRDRLHKLEGSIAIARHHQKRPCLANLGTLAAPYSKALGTLTTLSRLRFWVRRFADFKHFSLSYWILGRLAIIKCFARDNAVYL